MNAGYRKPLAVVRSAQAADAAIAAMQGTPAPVEAAPDQVVEDAEIVETTQAAPQTAPEAAPQATAEAPVTSTVDPAEFARLQQAHRVLQGKYTSEGQRDRETINGLRRDLESLRSLVASLQAKPVEPVEAPKTSLVSSKEVEEFGEDLLDAAGRYAAQQWQPLVRKLQDEIASLRADVTTAKTSAAAAQTSVTLSARDRMFAVLDEQITDWRTVNTDDAFKDWLAQEDDMSGETRQALLLKAYERNDGPRVARFFARYKAENTQSSAPSTVAAPAADAGAPGGKTRVDPAALVAPARGRSAPRPTGAQQIVWTPADIQQFYMDVQKGRYRNAPDELARLEQDIFTAQTEGRVQVA